MATTMVEVLNTAATENGLDPADPFRYGVADNEIVCYDEGGQPLGDYQALAAAPAAGTAACAVAEQRAATAEARLRKLEDELRRLRGE